MGLNASDMLGAREIVGTKINPRGLGKKVMSKTQVGGGNPGQMLGGAIARRSAGKKIAAEQAEAAASTAPEFDFLAWLSVTADELALIDIDGRTTLKLKEPLARVPRQQVASAELKGAAPMMAKPIIIRFTDGSEWVFEVPVVVKRHAKKVVAELNRQTATAA